MIYGCMSPTPTHTCRVCLVPNAVAHSLRSFSCSLTKLPLPSPLPAHSTRVRSQDVFGNMNVQAIEVINCVIGPRHSDRLVIIAAVTIGAIFATWAFVVMLQWITALLKKLHLSRHMHVRHFSRASKAVALARSVAIVFSVDVLFLVYPLSCSTILRTFLCTPFEVDGEKVYYMVDDLAIRCSFNSSITTMLSSDYSGDVHSDRVSYFSSKNVMCLPHAARCEHKS